MNNKTQKIALIFPLLLWGAFLAWWVGVNFFNIGSPDDFTDTYSVVALAGGIGGLITAKNWGLFRSRFGASIGYFSLGLILQFLGHLIYGLYFRIGGIELAYPSVGDIPFLLTGIAYVLALYNLLKVIVFNARIFKPLYVLLVSSAVTIVTSWLVYISFLNIAIHDERGLIFSIVNAAYPILQVFYFLLGVIALLQARRMAGGKMLVAVSVMLIALIIQYVADFSFLYQDYHELWTAAGSNDLIYLIAYGLMAFSLLMIDNVRVRALSKPAGSAQEGTKV